MTQLSLDGPTVHTTYYGRNVDQMPKLLAGGKEPMSVAHLMEQRVAVRQERVPQAQHDAWWCNYFDNADLWLRHPDKGGKVIPYSAQVLQFLREHIKPKIGLVDYALLFHIQPYDVLKGLKTKLVNYAVPLPEGLYEAMEGLELKPADIEKLHTKGYTPREAKQSDVWKELSGRSQQRLDKYVDAVVAETGRERGLMNLYFGKASKVPTGRLWYVGDRYIVSYAKGINGLADGYGRLVGVAPEAHVSSVTARSARKK